MQEARLSKLVISLDLQTITKNILQVNLQIIGDNFCTWKKWRIVMGLNMIYEI